jgi:pre-mRNA-splicing factor ATP-dependent RNA helicase DHX38/PRP16
MTANEEDGFVHEVAVKLSRVLNIINPNDLLATRVIDIARNNTESGFIDGTQRDTNSIAGNGLIYC